MTRKIGSSVLRVFLVSLLWLLFEILNALAVQAFHGPGGVTSDGSFVYRSPIFWVRLIACALPLWSMLARVWGKKSIKISTAIIIYLAICLVSLPLTLFIGGPVFIRN